MIKFYFTVALARYFWDVVSNNGNNSQNIYDRLTYDSHRQNTLKSKGYQKALVVIKNYRHWEFEGFSK